MAGDVPRIIDRFAGPGGWDEGLRMLGRTDVVGIEWDRAACETGRANGHRRVRADVAALDPHEFVAQHLGGAAPDGGIDSPPCQGFSTAGKGVGRSDIPRILTAVAMIGAGLDADVALANLRRQCADPRSALALEPLRWALALRPRWLAWEQVPAVLPLWEACADVLRAHGYSVWAATLRAEQYGVPQTRRRACLGASRVRTVEPPPPIPIDTQGAIGDVLPPPTSWPDAVIVGAGWSGEGRPRRLSDPAPTITGQGTAYWLPDVKHWRRQGGATGRRLAIHEAALLQGFPRGYQWRGTAVEQRQQVGNAIPPLLASHVLRSVGATS